MRGTIIKVPDSNPGIISAEGKQYSFELVGAWQGDAAPAANQVVEFTPGDDGQATAITVVSREVLAQENMNKAAKIAKQKAEGYYAIAKPYVDLQVKMMTLPVVVLAVIVEVSYFFLTGVSFEGGGLLGGLSASCSLDQIWGVDLIKDVTQVNYTFMRFVAEVLIFVPWIAPWLPIPHRKLLNALPLVTVGGVYLGLHHEIYKGAEEIVHKRQQVMNSMDTFLGGSSLTHVSPSAVSHQIDVLGGKIMDMLTFNAGFWVALVASVLLLGAALLPKRTA